MEQRSKQAALGVNTAAEQLSRRETSDPIGSIANVLNKHHKERQAAEGEKNALEEGKKAQLSQVKKSNKVEHRQRQQADKLQRTGAGKVSTVTLTAAPNQVDQANSYLYAYNDFVAPQVWQHSSQRHIGAGSNPSLGAAPAGESSGQRKERAVDVGELVHCDLHQRFFGGCGHQQDQLGAEAAAEEEGDEEEEEEEEENEALNYILNQHLSAATFVGAQQQQADIFLQANSAEQVAIGDNHLRRYLQIEENFNSFKAAAAKQRQPRELQQHWLAAQETAAPSDHLIVGGSRPQPPNCFLLSSPIEVEAEEEDEHWLSREFQEKKKAKVFNSQRQQTNHANQPLEQRQGSSLWRQPTKQDQQGNANNLQSSSTAKATSCGNFLVFVPATHAAIQSHQQQEAAALSGLAAEQNKKLTKLPLIKNLANARKLNLARGRRSKRESATEEQRSILTSSGNLLLFGSRAGKKGALTIGPSSGCGGGDGDGDMYAANGGQPGAYYVTSSSLNGAGQQSSSSSNGSSEQGQQYDQNLHHHDLHLHHQHLLKQSSGVQQGGNYQSSSSADSSLGSTGAFATAAVAAATAAALAHGSGAHRHQQHARSRRRPSGAHSLATTCARQLLSCSCLADFCSKKCLFTTCLVSLLFIFILVISLSAYLNFLITTSKSNLQPLSGRLRYELSAPNGSSENDPTTLPPADTANAKTQLHSLFNNKTSREFMQKQQQFETILRGAFDRAQPLLKSYPNHLVKLEVYSFKPQQQPHNSATLPSALWVYFRLFINKRTMQQDAMLMKRKSPDELFDKQFLPRLTQQTLHSGFEQLIAVFGNRLAPPPNGPAELRSLASDSNAAAIVMPTSESTRRFNGQQTTNNGASEQPSLSVMSESRRLNPRATNGAAAAAAKSARVNSQQQQQLRSFDEQISRLMHLVEAIDLQSIQVTPEFDMQSSLASSAPQEPAIMSDNLRALQPIVTTTTESPAPAVMAANGGRGSSSAAGKLLEAEDQPATQQQRRPNEKGETNSSAQASTPRPSAANDSSASANTRKFTLQGYRENASRPSSSTAAPVLTSPASRASSAAPQRESLFLVNQQQKKRVNQVTGSPQAPSSSNTLRDIAQAAARAQQSQAPQSSHENDGKEKVIRLVSGQPVVSQHGQPKQSVLNERHGNSGSRANQSSVSRSHSSPTTTIVVASKYQDSERPANETAALASGRWESSQAQKPPLPTSGSIEELWNNALRSHNSTVGGAASGGRRLITVTTIGGQQQAANASEPSAHFSQAANNNSTQRHKVSVTLGSEVSDAIRAQMTTTTPASTSTSTAASSTSKAPKVSPHLKLAGSLISTPSERSRSETSPQPPSAIVLNRDVASSGNHENEQRQTVPLVNGTTSGGATQQRNQKHKQKGTHRTGTSNSTSSSANQAAAQSRSTTTSKPNIKLQKLKKVVTASAQNNGTGTLEDKQLAAPLQLEGIGSGAAPSSAPQRSAKANNNANRTFASPSEPNALPTLPTTIELTRSASTALPPRALTTPLAPSDSNSSEATNERNRSRGQPPESRQSSAEQHFVPASQQARPGTSSFSGQWRPLQSSGGAATTTPFSSANVDDFWLNTSRGQQDNATSGRARRPSLALIIGTERLPASLNEAQLSGSRSPFAMPQQQAAQFANRFRAASQPALRLHQHDFESHRTSRMRQRQQATSGNFSTSDSIASTTSKSSSLSSSIALAGTTSSSLNVDDSNSRLVDDFMVTTTSSSNLQDNSPRSVTLLPHLVLSSFHKPPQSPGQLEAAPLAPGLVAAPKRTRGPFAFETLLGGENTEEVAATLAPSAANLPAASFDIGSPLGLIPSISSRAERSPSVIQPYNQQQQVDDKLLLRKRLFVGNGNEDEMNISSSTNPTVALAEVGQSEGAISRASETNQLESTNSTTGHCQYFGCQAKGSSNEFICLNRTQICDDFIDCHDESDELDCVSLVRPSNEQGTERMSFSNGAGIIYLNRRGSVAPMCIDYYAPSNESSSTSPHQVAGARISASDSQRTNSAHDLEAVQMQAADATRRQQELIRQINTIGQYACSLQSFSRLVSVKINHHDLVDGLNLIKTSKVYHRLGILSSSQSGTAEATSGRFGDAPSSPEPQNSFKSGLPNYEVEISTGSECPSQRTVFVKCGHFECGQDSFSVMDQFSGLGEASASDADELNASKRHRSNKKRPLNGVVLSDFPWLVKLYWHGSLACHGFLIDESWLIAATECFSDNNATRAQNKDDPSGWSAEISHEHYGNEDYKSIELNRRKVKDIHFSKRQYRTSGPNSNIESSIVLAKLEKAVRFSPLNRPICLPQTRRQASTGGRPAGHQQRQQSGSPDLELDKDYRDCVTAKLGPRSSSTHLRFANSNSTSGWPPTQQGLILNKVRLSTTASDCLQQLDGSPSDGDSLSKHFVCANQLNAPPSPPPPATTFSRGDENFAKGYNTGAALICSLHHATSRLRSRWTIVGVQSSGTPDNYRLAQGGQLFTRVSSQIGWIVDTTNPPSNHHLVESLERTADSASQVIEDYKYNPDAAPSQSVGSIQFSTFLEVPTNSLLISRQQQSTCKWFKCSSGECLPWSRICDGLYDCSSHDDEKDCHK